MFPTFMAKTTGFLFMVTGGHRPARRLRPDQPDLAVRPLRGLQDLLRRPARLVHGLARRRAAHHAGVGVDRLRPHHPARGLPARPWSSPGSSSPSARSGRPSSGKTPRTTRCHNLLDRPRDRPKRTAAGAAMLALLFTLFFASSTDVLANFFHLSLNVVLWFFRFVVIVVADHRRPRDLQDLPGDAGRRGHRQAQAGRWSSTGPTAGEYTTRSPPAPAGRRATRSSSRAGADLHRHHATRSWPRRPASAGSSADRPAPGRRRRASLGPHGTHRRGAASTSTATRCSTRAGPALAAVVADARAQLAGHRRRRAGRASSPGGHRRHGGRRRGPGPPGPPLGGEGTAYLEFPDFSLPEDHPRLHLGAYAVRRGGLRPHAHRLPAPPALRVGAAAGPGRGRPRPGGGPPLRRPLRRAQPRRHGRGRRAAVALRPDRLRGVAGHPDGRRRRATSRSIPDPHAPTTSATTRWPPSWPAPGTESSPCPWSPGTLLVFEGRHSLHRVSPVGSGLPRHVGLLAYDTRPGTMGSDLLRQDRYGRTEPFATPPDVWPAP